MANVSWKCYSSAIINDEDGPTRFSVAAFLCSAKGEVPVVSFLDFRVPIWVLLTNPLFKWGLLHESPSCGASLISFSNGAGFNVCVLQAILPLGGEVCFFFCCNDLALHK